MASGGASFVDKLKLGSLSHNEQQEPGIILNATCAAYRSLMNRLSLLLRPTAEKTVSMFVIDTAVWAKWSVVRSFTFIPGFALYSCSNIGFSKVISKSFFRSRLSCYSISPSSLKPDMIYKLFIARKSL